MIAMARQQSGLSFAKLAKRAGTSPATLHAYEHGRIVPRFDTLVRVLDAAGLRMHIELRPSASEEARSAEFEKALSLAAQYPSSSSSEMVFPVFPERRN